MAGAVPIGAHRDRTNLFISYRQSYAHHPAARRTRFAGPSNGRYTDEPDSERAGLMSRSEGEGDAVIEMDVLPPRWLDIQDDIGQLLTDMTGKMKRLDQMHAKHVLPGFDDESVKAKEEREIEAVTQDITRDFTSCQKLIRRIDVLVREQQQHSGAKPSSTDATMARNLKMSLASRVGDVSTLFRKKQSAYLKKLRSLGGLSASSLDRSSTPITQSPYADAAMLESESDRSSAQTTLLQTAQVRQRGALDTSIAQREREIERIAQGVIDLSNLFQELQTMVLDQGTLLDRVDYNVENTREAVQAADTELRVATRHQKRGTRRMLILLLILLVVGALILLLVKPKRGAARPSPAPAPALPQEPPGVDLPPSTKHARWKQQQQQQQQRWRSPRSKGADGIPSSFP